MIVVRPDLQGIDQIPKLDLDANERIEAAMKADAMLDRGDLDGAAVWRQIVAAINELLSTGPGDGDAVH